MNTTKQMTAVSLLLTGFGVAAQGNSPVESSPTVEHPAVALAPQVQAKGGEGATLPFAGKPPFTAGEFWQKILTLLADRNGDVSKERFEEVMGMRFANTSKSNGVTNHFNKPLTDSYMSTSLIHLEDRPHFNHASSWYVGWELTTFGDSDKDEAIAFETAHTTLIAAGWQEVGVFRWQTREAHYTKRGGKDRINFLLRGKWICSVTVTIGRA